MSVDFDTIANRMTRVSISPEDEPAPPDPEDGLSRDLHVWAKDRIVDDVFLPWLNDHIDELDEVEASVAKDHASLLLAKGQRLEAKWLRDEFLKWRGTPRIKERP